MERLLLLSTCGTSLLTNGAPEETRQWLVRVANESSLQDSLLADLVAKCRDKLRNAEVAERRRLSAELNGIGAVMDRFQPQQVQHLLVHTDTAVGRAAADLVVEVLRSEGVAVDALTAGGLRTDHPASFREAISELTREIEDRATGYREKGWMVAFNLTGGFKPLNAYLQALGMLFADRCVFLFEGAGALMEIPRLPVRLADAEELRAYLTVFRRLARGFRVLPEETRDMPDALVLVLDGQVTTSVWGDVVWSRIRSRLLAEALQEPLSKRVRLSPKIGTTFLKLDARERVAVNEALDDFSAHVDGVRPLPASRQFKKLQGDPVPGSTHELYAWTYGSAGRLFGHYRGDGSFFFDKLDPKHL